MTAFNKLVKASETLPTQPKVSHLLAPAEILGLSLKTSYMCFKLKQPQQTTFIQGYNHQPGPQQLLGGPFQGMCKPMSPVSTQMSQLELQQVALKGLALLHDLAVQTAPSYQSGFSKPQVDRTRVGLRKRQQ